MFKKFKMDYDLSRKMYEENKYLVKVKECYHNIALLVINHITYEEELCDIKVAFGAWQISLGNEDNQSNVYAKHCFFLLGDKVIDTTHFTTTKEQEDRNYLVFKTFDISEYLKALENNNKDTSLPKYTEKVYRSMFLKMMEANLVLLG